MFRFVCVSFPIDRIDNDVASGGGFIFLFALVSPQVTVEDHGKALTEPAQWDSCFVDFLREAPEATGDETEDADLEAPKVCSLLSAISLYITIIIHVIIHFCSV